MAAMSARQAWRLVRDALPACSSSPRHDFIPCPFVTILALKRFLENDQGGIARVRTDGSGCAIHRAICVGRPAAEAEAVCHTGPKPAGSDAGAASTARPPPEWSLTKRTRSRQRRRSAALDSTLSG